jgi:hypothetical protein
MGVSSCDGLFLEPTGAAPLVGLHLTAAVLSPLTAAVFAKVERADLIITRPDGGERRLVVGLEKTDDGARAAVSLEPREIAVGLTVRAELRTGTISSPLFAGQATLHASEAGSLSAEITVLPVPALLVVAPTTVTFDALEASQPMSASVRFATGDPFPATASFASSNPSIAQVSPDGIVTSKRVGEASVVVTYANLLRSVGVIVRQTPASVAISPPSPSIAIGQTVQLSAVTVDRNGFVVSSGGTATWRSVNTRVGTVSPSGVVTGVDRGQVQIVATIGSVSGSRIVSVAMPEIPSAELVWTLPSGLAVGDFTGAGRTITTQNAFSPAWSPDHRFVAFTNGNGHLLVTDLNGMTRRLDSAPIITTRWPEYSADGSWIYFSGDTQVGSQRVAAIYRVRPDGSGITKVSTGPQATAPTTSPDGTMVAYAALDLAQPGRTTDLVVERIGGAPQVIAAGVRPVSLRWSPDGQWIAYSTWLTHELWVIRPDGSNHHSLGDFTHAYEGMSWSPDGRWLVGVEAYVTLIDVANSIQYDLAWQTNRFGISWWR